MDIRIVEIIFYIMCLMPLVTAVVYYKKKRLTVIELDMDYKREPRYFAKKFSGVIEDELPRLKDNMDFIAGDKTYEYVVDDKEYPPEVEHLVINEEDFLSPDGVRSFEKEIYCGRNAYITNRWVKLKALYAGGDVSLAEGCNVTDWIDAENNMKVMEDCNLGISCSSGKSLTVSNGCRFKRLYSKEILISPRMAFEGDHSQPEPEDESSLKEGNIISKKNIKTEPGDMINGGISGRKNVIIGRGSVITGNVFAERNIILEPDVKVYGNIFAYGNIKIGENCIAGSEYCKVSVISRKNMILGRNVKIYGYVCCEGRGECVFE